MTLRHGLIAVSFAALVAATPAAAQAQSQTQGQTQQDRVGAILGALFGDRLGVSTNLDAQWAAGRSPLTGQRAQFDGRVDADVRSGALNAATGARLKSDYAALTALETRYAADGRFTTQERTDLGDRYGALTQALAEGGFAADAAGGAAQTAVVADGRADFDARVNAAVAARRITRTQGNQLRADYQALVGVEAGYLRAGITARQREDLDARLDALDARLGDGPAVGGGASVALDPRSRLAAIETALAAGERSGAIPRAEAAEIRVQHGDLVRLEAAYARASPSGDDSAYLIRRLGELEARARVQVRR